MSPSLRFALCALLAVFTGSVAARNIDASKFKPEDTITRDVAVVGGGASGTYAAVRLKDSGKTVVVIESQDQLGGHVDTYTDPTTGFPLDYGVQAYITLPGVKEFFARFNIPTIAVSQPSFVTQYIDFSTGKPVANYPASDQTAMQTALGTYAQITGQYLDLFFPGYWNLTLPIPDDLAMPFGQFVQKYNLAAMLPIAWGFISAVGDVLDTPTLIMMQNFNAVHIQSLSSGGFFVPASHNNSQLYAAALGYLSADVLLGSHVSAASRENTGVKLLVKTPAGPKLVIAKKLLFTAPPTTDNLATFDLDGTESALFSKWQFSSVYVGVLSKTGLPDGLDLENATPNPAKHNLPTVPFVAQFIFSGLPGLYRAMVVAEPGSSQHDAKQLARAALDNMARAGTYKIKRSPNFVAFAGHSPLQLRPSAADLMAGFYQQIYSLQGRRSTFYTGAAWSADLTSTLWLFTETGVLPAIKAGL
ncbi:putative amine oxidase [Diplogelasinospora grovesii]|uniref:Amine oxidase n=1 Tax=Diplogelasinospora grovesii TaxID=303347 RepID=A0AAN6RZI3_9PEZI|nr:putative amine oxidase [Diplogelasinospora grovesii]